MQRAAEIYRGAPGGGRDDGAGPRRGGQLLTYRSRHSSATGWAAQFEDSDTGDEVELGDAGSFGLIINAPADDTTEWELFYSRQSAGIDRSTVPVDPSLDIDISYFQVGGTYVFEGAPIRPFISAGIGASQFSPDQSAVQLGDLFRIQHRRRRADFSREPGRTAARRARVRLRHRQRQRHLLRLESRWGDLRDSVRDGDILWQWEVFAGLTARF